MPGTGLRPAWERQGDLSDLGDAGYQLLDAIDARDMSRAQGLLMAKVDVNRHRDRYGRSTLHLSALQGVVGLCRMLINHGAELDCQEAGSGNTTLHMAVLNWQNLMIRVILEAKASPNIVNSIGETPLMLAVNAGNMQAMQLLLDFGANVDFTSDDGAVAEGGSVLLRAVQRQVLCELVQLLVAGRAQLESRDDEKNCPLHIAVQNGDPRIARLLLEQRCDPDASNMYGRTAMHVAAATGSVRSVRLLAEFRADVNKIDCQQTLPMQLANSSCQRALRELGALEPSEVPAAARAASPASPARPVSGSGCSPSSPVLVEGGEWAMGPKGGGIYPAGRFRVEHQDLAKRPSPERRRAPGTPSMPRHHGAHGVGGGALRPMTGQRSLPVLDTAEAGALRRMRSLPQLVVGGGKGQML